MRNRPNRNRKQFDLYVLTNMDGQITEWWLKSWVWGRPWELTVERQGQGEPPADVLELVHQRVCYV